MAKKVRFGLKSVHYAKLTEGTSPSWGTPVAMPGAVALSLSQEGSRDNFYADNITYYVSIANNGYSGDLELARVDDKFLKDIWGFTEDTSGVLMESSSVEPSPFALLFQVDSDEDDTRYVLYRCFADRPNLDSQTIEDSKTPQTQTIGITAVPVINGPLDGVVLGKTGDTVSTTVVSNWFSSVYTG